jgi:hypothetical protein
MPIAKSISKTGTETLDRLKKNINASYLYFKPNYDRFHHFRRFVFETSLDSQEKDILTTLKKPIIEFNILEAYISRLLGEFAKHEPSIEITPADGVPIDLETIKLVEGHIRHIIYEANKNSCSYEVYKDLLSGGFSTVKVWTDYASNMSFNQVIKLGRVFDPTLCGFDPMARYSHKADGRYCYEIFPQAREDFERENPTVDINSLSFSRNIEGFNWSYRNGSEDIVILGEYWEKKKKKAKIVKLANGRVMTEKNYEKFQEYWKKEGFIAQIPAVIGKSRNTELETICRYRLIESEILDYKETDYTYLPLIFVDGNSIILRDGDGTNNSTMQMTRPYVYHAEGIQKLKNFAGQTLGNELENMIQHKIMIAKESLPQEEEFLAAYDNVQQASTYVYQAYSENNPDQQLPQPREVVRTPIPQEVMATYGMTDSTTQVILGSFDAALGINDNQLSGVAIQTAATQSNQAAMPFVTGYLQAWTHIACVCVDLLPLYIVTPRTIPVVGLDGKREYKKVNDPKNNGPSFDYDKGALQVYIEAGVNFQIQKNQALQQIVLLMQASPSFAEFMNGPGLDVLVSNLTCYHADVLKQMVPEWEKQKEQMKQEQMQQQKEMMANDPAMVNAKIKMQEIQQKGQLEQAKMQAEQKQQEFDNQVTLAKIQIDKEQADAKAALDQNKLQQDSVESQVQIEKAKAEIQSHQIDAQAKMVEARHKVTMDHVDRITEHEKHEHERNMDNHKSIRESVKLKNQLDQANKLKSKENEGEENV